MCKSAKLWFAVVVLLISFDWSASRGHAQSFPGRPVKIVMPQPAGGVSDTLTRALAQELSRKWGQPVVVENRAGGGGVVATLAVSKSSPDGHSILMTNSAVYLTTPILQSNPSYDPVNDLEPVMSIAATSDVLLTNPNSPIKSVQDLIEIARARPGQLNYGSFGPGSATHFDMESLASVAGIKLVHIPYRGGVEVVNALVAGQIDVAFTGLTPAIPLIEGGRLRALAYNGPRRSIVLPNVPTLAEAGLKGVLEGSWWFALMVPRGTPGATVGKIAADAGEVLGRPDFAARFITGVGLEPMNLSAAELAQRIKVDSDTFTKLVRDLNLEK